MNMEFFYGIKSVILTPREFFSRQAEAQNLKQGLIAFLAMGLMGFLIQLFLMPLKPEFMPIIGMNATVVFLLLFPVVVLLTLFFIGIEVGILHLFVKLFGGVGEFKALYTCTLFLQAAIGLVSIPVTLINHLFMSFSTEKPSLAVLVVLMGIGLCMFIWMFYLNVLAVKCCYQLSTAKSVMVHLVPLGIFVLFVGLLILGSR